MTGSSGDLLADRRYRYAEAAFQEGDVEAAADLAHQALEIAPGFAAAWFLLGQAREAQFRALESGPEASGLFRDAVVAFQTALASDPDDPFGAGLRLARLGVGDPLEALAPGYVRALFDEYAIRFDRHLVRSLKYRAPALLRDAVQRVSPGRPRFRQALDLGCGTGLAAEAFRDICDGLAGIDLSPAMVARARAKRVYDELEAGDLVAWLGERPEGAADLVLAADVFVYLGDLAPAFAAAARALAPGGLCAFTVQAHAGEGVALGPDLRYAHGRRHVLDLASGARLHLALVEPVVTRQDRGADVPGLLFVLQR